MKTINEYISTIKNTLHLDAKVIDEKIPYKTSIPLAIKSNYFIYTVKIENISSIVLLIKHDIKSFKKHLQIFRSAIDMPIILAIEHISSSTKTYLIENNIPFISLDAIYLPQLLVYIDTLSKKDIKLKSKKLSKLAQTTLIYLLLNKDKKESKQLDITAIAKLWSVSDMSASRTLNELVEFGYLYVETIGRKIYFYLNHDIDFEELMQVLKTPIMDTIYIKSSDLIYLKQKAISSYTALSKYANITSHQNIYAIEKDYFNKIVKTDHDITLYDNTFDESIVRVELWRYRPISIYNETETVDIISLYISLKDTLDKEDTRLIDAFKELEETIKKAIL
jgi:hypothetical protein